MTTKIPQRMLLNLNNVNNTSDVNKPISIATQAALDLKASTALVTTAVSGLMVFSDKVKLNGIASGATVNSTDSALRDRTSHTGTQAISTISNLQAALGAIDTTLTKLDLTSQYTSPAIQVAVNKASDNGKRAVLSNGDYAMADAIVSGSNPTVIAGAGPLSTRLLSSGTNVVVAHGLLSQVFQARLTLRDIGIFSTSSATSSATAIKAAFNRDSGGFNLENVDISSFSADYGFNKYVEAVGATFTSFKNVKAGGSTYGTPAQRADGPQIGFHFISHVNSDKSYEYNFEDCLVGAEVNGFLFDVLGFPGDTGSLEGVKINRCGGRTNLGHWLQVNVPNSLGTWYPPVFRMIQSNYEGPGGIAKFDGVEHFIMQDCWHAISPDPYNIAPAFNSVEIKNGRKIVITGNTFHVFPGGKLLYFLNFLAGCNDVVITNNTFFFEDQVPLPHTSISGGLIFDTSLTGLQCYGNRFLNWPSHIPKAQWSDGTPIDAEATYGASPWGGSVTSTDGSNTTISGTVTGKTFRYGQIVNISGNVTISNVGNGSGYPTFQLPYAPSENIMIPARRGSDGQVCQIIADAGNRTATITLANNGSPLALSSFVFTGFYPKSI